MSRRYLTSIKKESLKSSFTPGKKDWVYHPALREIGIVLTQEDLYHIHDFVVFQESSEYNEWLKSKRKQWGWTTNDK